MKVAHFKPSLGLLMAGLALGQARADFPKNLLRTHAGARWVESAAPAIHDDPSALTRVKTGKAVWIADLGQHHLVDRISFQNVGILGELSLEASPSIHLPNWQRLGSVDLVKTKLSTSKTLIPTVARYVRFTVDTETAGDLRGLALFGPLLASEVQPVPASAWSESSDSYHSIRTFSLLNGLTTASVKDVSAGQGLARHLRDEDVTTAYRFSDREQPRILLDLGNAFNLKSLVILQSEVAGSWRVLSGEGLSAAATEGVAWIDLGGQVAKTLELVWEGSSDPPTVYEIAVFPTRGLGRTSGYGKNASYGKNVALGKQGEPEDSVTVPLGDGAARRHSPYFGIRGVGGLSVPNGFSTRVPGFDAGDDGVPDITPGSF